MIRSICLLLLSLFQQFRGMELPPPPSPSSDQEDYISDLPNSVIEIILMLLPIKNAVRTSILSSRWRYAWCTIPRLKFKSHSSSDEDPERYRRRFVRRVDQVLLLHQGPIHMFALDVNLVPPLRELHRWMLHLSRNCPRELIILLWDQDFYPMPSSFFLFDSILHVELRHFDLRLPSVFTGFGRLSTLVLRRVRLTNYGLETLVSGSPRLRKLVIKDCVNLRRIRIKAPNLEELHIRGAFQSLRVEATPSLVDLSVGLPRFKERGGHCGFTECFQDIHAVERLGLLLQTFKFVARGYVPERLPITCTNNLKELTIGCLNFDDINHGLMLLCFLASSPLLRKLAIESDSPGKAAYLQMEKFYDAREKLDCELGHLKTVSLASICGAEPELDFIELVLASAPILETMTLRFIEGVKEEGRAFKEIMKFRRASTRATVICSDD